MESVKIFITNGSPGSGKSTLSLALATYMYNRYKNSLPEDFVPLPTLFDCTDNLYIYNKRNEEYNKSPDFIPPFEILPLSLKNEILFINSIKLISNRDAAYIFNIPDTISKSLLFQILNFADYIICPFILTDMGVYETARFVLFIKKAVQAFRNEKVLIDPKIILVPNMVPESGIDPHISENWESKTKAFLPLCKITSNIPWRDNLINDLSTTEWLQEFDDLFGDPFNTIGSLVYKKYQDRHRTKSS